MTASDVPFILTTDNERPGTVMMIRGLALLLP